MTLSTNNIQSFLITFNKQRRIKNYSKTVKLPNILQLSKAQAADFCTDV